MPKADKGAAADGGRGKKVRKLKDHNAPKKPVSAFMLWSQDARAEIKRQNPDLDFGGIGRKMGEIWKDLDDDTKNRYQKLADAEKERYNRDMAAYQNSPLYHEFEQKKAGQGHSSKLPGQPKRPTTPFMIFATQERPRIKEANPGISFGDIGKRLGELWNQLTPEQKKIYEDEAEKDKRRYEAEMQAFNAKLSGGHVATDSHNDEDDDDEEDED